MFRKKESLLKLSALTLAVAMLSNGVGAVDAQGKSLRQQAGINAAIAANKYALAKNAAMLSDLRADEAEAIAKKDNKPAKPNGNTAENTGNSNNAGNTGNAGNSSSGNTGNSGSSSSGNSGSSAGKAEKLPDTYGKFDPSVYGYTGADKVSYWKNINPDVIGYLRVPGTNISYPVVQNTYDINYYLHKNIYTGADKVSYWKNINPDVIGYLRVPGTNISYPVVQNTYDINYYLHKNIYGNSDRYGVVWTNTDTNSSGSSATMSDNTVLYGHNWKNVSANPRVKSPNDIMFEQLTSYHYADMGRTYPYIYYTSLEEEMTFVIFATFYTEVDFNYIQTEGANDYIINEALSRSRNTFGVDVNGDDKIITLSTCTRAYGKSDRQRFVVMARMLRPGETIAPIDVQYNPNHKQPSNLW